MPRPARVRTLLTLLVAAAVLTTVGCATTIPNADSTPPDVRLTVTGLGSAFTLTSTSQDESRTISPGPNVAMLAVAADDGGVKNVGISGSMTVNCSSGDLGQRSFVHFAASNPEPDAGAGPGDEVLDRRITSLEIDTSNLPNYCRGDFTFTGAGGSFRASGENFHGGTAESAVFSLTVN